jgi:hypothetical protein
VDGGTDRLEGKRESGGLAGVWPVRKRGLWSKLLALCYDEGGAECMIMKTQDGIIEGTVQEVMAKLAHVPAGERVRVMVGRPSLTVIARRLQTTAAANGMTEAIHNDLLRSLKNDC